MKDLKYLLAYIIPLLAFIGIHLGAYWTFAVGAFAFGLVPIIEYIGPKYTDNFDATEESNRLVNRFFDLMLYLNLPILYLLLWFYFDRLADGGLAIYEIVGMTLSVGLTIGALGINVAHELGHRNTWYEQLMSKLLLLPALYMHFIIEHNRGHHKNVATDEDPASARYGEILYVFWIRSTIGSYLDAWKLENNRLKKLGLSPWNIKNEMIHFHFIQLGYLLLIGSVFSWTIALFAIIVGVTGFLQLETVNYIEHYGLRRKKLPSGRYENVEPRHSWNSNHELGRILLYELTRHADHHFKANRKYQILRHMENSPQLPYGYPTSILLSMVPPLWFAIMNKEVNRYQTS